MDPIVTPIAIILAKYALDKGGELAKEGGPAALEKAKEMLGVVLERVGRKKPETATGFPQDPETYRRPLERALDAEVSADEEFAACLKGLLAEYEQAAQAHAAAMGPVYEAKLEGSGAIAQGPGAVAAGAGGVAVGGNFQGNVYIGPQPRHLSAEQRQAMLPLLEKLRGRPVAFACHMLDGESCDYATELAVLFLQAGCQVPEPIKTSLNDLPGYLALAACGEIDTEIPPLLANVFQAAGIPARIETIKENSVGSWYQDVVHVIVGRKAHRCEPSKRRPTRKT